MSDLIRDAEDLREKVWAEIQASSLFALFKALDDTVVSGGGQSLLASGGATPIKHRPILKVGSDHPRRVSQAEAAETALLKAGEPLIAAELIEAAIQEGASVGGEKPLVSFTSTLSKDNRFYSFRRDGSYFWWLEGKDIPLDWKKAEPDDFSKLLGPASPPSRPKGGDAYEGSTIR